MGAVFDISLPTFWAELSDKMLRTVYTLFARDLSAVEVKTLCLMKWNKLTVLAQLRNHKYLVKRNHSQVIISSKQIQQATCFLDFLDTFPPVPVRLSRIGRHRALPADFEKVPFEKYLYLENLFQGYYTRKSRLRLLRFHHRRTNSCYKWHKSCTTATG